MPGSHDDEYEEEPLTPGAVARAALQDVTELTGREASGVTAIEAADDGSWLVEVEVVEERRIPSSGDILAIYRAQVDADGALTGLRRARRYSRGKGDTEAA